MDPRFAGFNVTTGILAILTAWVLTARLRGVVESNWPMLYYVGVVFYSTIFPSVLDPAWIYAGVLCTLFLRFEFMGGFFLKVIRVLDVMVLIYLMYTAVVSVAL